MKKIFIYFITVILVSTTAFSQEIIPPSGIKWYKINEAFELSKKEPKPIIVYVYTDWCSWCKFLMKTTFANNAISNYINTYFYPVRFNAETLDTIQLDGIKYVNRKIGAQPVHDLATKLLDAKFTYPSLVFFDRQGRKTIIPGYKEVKDIEPILIYYAENVYQNASPDDFIINYMFSFSEAFKNDHSIFKIDNSQKPDTLGIVKWIGTDKLAGLQKKNKKPVMVYFYTDWSVSSKVMDKTTFGNRELATRLNERYYSVRINAASQESISFMGKTFSGTGPNQPHQLTQELLKGNFLMPAIVFYDENNVQLSVLNGYLLKDQMIKLEEYFYNKIYKKLSLQEYINNNQSGKPMAN
ncbi:MAG: DUF255 domain-containing protein [Bacteroidales bacterium]